MEYIDEFKLPFFSDHLFNNKRGHYTKLFQYHRGKNGKKYKEFNSTKWI